MIEKRTYKKLTPVQKLVVVNARLRHGDMAKVAKITGFSSTMIKTVVEGRSFNDRILNTAYDMTRQRKKNFQVIKDMKAKITKLTETV
jgi:hypothetical protein